MYIQSNDFFIGANDVFLFDSEDQPISGDITDQVRLYDAGSEVDEYADAGFFQAPCQSTTGEGPAENGLVGVETNPSPNIPALENIVRVTITPQ